MPSTDPRTRPRTIAIAATVLLVLAGFGWHLRQTRLHIEQRAGAAASLVAGRPVRVHCPGQLKRRFMTEINDGEVQFVDGRPADETQLTARVCDGLGRLLDKDAQLDQIGRAHV